MATYQNPWETQTQTHSQGDSQGQGPSVTTAPDSAVGDVNAPIDGGPVAGAIERSAFTMEEVQILLTLAILLTELYLIREV